ncbi:MAG: YggT family protein [Treponema sp.]|nr:YggT family protein [Treponema sp.]
MSILGTFTSIYMLILLVRILLTWFSGVSYSRPVEVLSRITDPYLDWFRRFPVLRIGRLDLSPVAALAVLSVANRTFAILARYGTISLGIILAMFLQALWSAVSFILGFSILILILRLIAYLTSRNTYSPFWRIIDTISQPLLFRINRILFGDRIVHYRTGLIAALLVLGAAMMVLGVLVGIFVGLLGRLPV